VLDEHDEIVTSTMATSVDDATDIVRRATASNRTRLKCWERTPFVL
jgi:hypothetical protein